MYLRLCSQSWALLSLLTVFAMTANVIADEPAGVVRLNATQTHAPASDEGVVRMGQSSVAPVIRAQSPGYTIQQTSHGHMSNCPTCYQGEVIDGVGCPNHGVYCICKECKEHRAARKACKSEDACWHCKLSACPNCDGQFCDSCPVCQQGCLAKHNYKFHQRTAACSYGIERWMACHFGYFIPRGGADGKGLPPFGHYSRVYPVDPSYFDQRDSSVYAAQGYGVPVAVPLAPNVHHQYNFSWGVPSSRLTPVGNVTSTPY